MRLPISQPWVTAGPALRLPSPCIRARSAWAGWAKNAYTRVFGRTISIAEAPFWVIYPPTPIAALRFYVTTCPL